MITMQNPDDGRVYHKLTTKNFEGFVMPDQGKEPRYVVQKNSAATLDFAATMAQSARIFKAFETQLPGWSDSCLVAAKYAWEWAIKNPDIRYDQPEDITTGGYGDKNLSDEWFWAACELYLATGEDKYKEKILISTDHIKVPDWGSVYTHGIISLLNHPEMLGKIDTGQFARKGFLLLADSLVKTQQESPYNTSITRFRWGSSSDVANYGLVKLIAYQQTKEKKYLYSAMTDRTIFLVIMQPDIVS
jgi:endoglucanase